MIFGSVCSGIEAATVAWHPLGWRARFYAEIADFPSRLLAHHYPETPNHGDFTKIDGRDDAPLDLLVGGTPCQSFSVAGLGGGLGDERGVLALEFLRLAARTRARWVVWENVPGVLSNDEGRAFGSILGGLAELGYGFAYRVLDAQYVRVESHARAVPQRRRRVFVVGHSGGDWQRAAAVLFERASLSGDPPPRRTSGEGVASEAGRGAAGRGGGDVARTLRAQAQSAHAEDAETYIPEGRWWDGSDVAPTLDSSVVAKRQTMPDKGRFAAVFDSPIAFDTTQITSKANRSNPQPGDPCHPLASHAHPPAIAFHMTQDPIDGSEFPPSLGAKSGGMGVCVPINLRNALRSGGSGGHTPGSGIGEPGDPAGTITSAPQGVYDGVGVRRLTPRECERLMGLPDDYTAIPGAADGPRYMALGNSMAANVMRWIGERIAMVDAL